MMILIGLAVYLFAIDRRIAKLEKIYYDDNKSYIE